MSSLSMSSLKWSVLFVIFVPLGTGFSIYLFYLPPTCSVWKYSMSFERMGEGSNVGNRFMILYIHLWTKRVVMLS